MNDLNNLPLEAEVANVEAKERSWLHDITYNLALLAGSLLCFLLIMEIGGRLTGLLPPPSNLYQFSPTAGYTLTPGYEEINTSGLRDREYPIVKPPHTFRIFAIGDSFTFGHGVRLEESYPKQLEAILNQQDGENTTHFEVLNAGVPGYNTAQELIRLQEVGLQFDPDLLIIGFTLGDAEVGDLGLKDIKNHLWLIRVKEWLKGHVALYGFLRLRMRRLLDSLDTTSGGYEGGGSAMKPLTLAAKGEPSPGWDLCAQSLKDIATIAKARHIPVLLVIFPLFVQLDETYPFQPEHALITKTAQSNQMTVLDLLPSFLGHDPAKLWVTPTDSHPNAQGQTITAMAIAQTLRAHGLLSHTVLPQ